MARYILILILAALAACTATTKTDPMDQPPQDREDLEILWKKVDSLDKKGLPQSAYAEVQKIKHLAREGHVQDHWLKALQYESAYLIQLNEEGYLPALDSLRAALEIMPQPGLSILHSYLAAVYQDYLQSNYWRISQRTADSGIRKEDIRTWTPAAFLLEISRHYRQSVSEVDLLRETPHASFSLLIKEGELSEGLRPTLYDVLAHRALEFFSRDQNLIPGTPSDFRISDAAFLAAAADFIALEIPATRETDQTATAMRIFQELTRFHLESGNTAALVDVELKRYGFVSDQGIFPQKDSLYRMALSGLEAEVRDNPAQAEVYYHIAQWHQKKGGTYRPIDFEGPQWEIREAMRYLQLAQESWPGSYGAQLCAALQSRIEQPNVQLTAETVYVPGDQLRFVIRYNNLEELHLRLIPVTYDQYRRYQRMKHDRRIPWLAGQDPLRAWSLDLQDEGDYQTHSMEFHSDPADPGLYALLTSADPGFGQKENNIQVAFFHVTDISFTQLQSTADGSALLFFDRTSGIPLHGVNVSALRYRYRGERDDQREEIIFTGATGEDGVIRIPASEGVPILVSAEWKEQVYQSLETIYINRRRMNPLPNTFTHFFTDRAIYRPGQTIHYKAVLMNRDPEGIPSIRPDEEIEITFYDQNNQQIERQKLRTGEYGSVSGSFTAPTGVLTGRMVIRSSWGGETWIRVEEYKRPKFKVELDPLEGEVALLDSISVNGLAEAYTGAALDRADVRYRVVRRAMFPYWDSPYWRPSFFSSDEMEIAQGQLTTGDDGRFSFEFHAIPDYSIEKKYKPVFRYTVYVDVTDVNGETHSATRVYTIGYQRYILQIDAPVRIPAGNESGITWKVRNHDGQAITTEVEASISRLEQPDAFQIDRYWMVPDRYDLGEEAFGEMFPYLTYREQPDYDSWEEIETLWRDGFTVEGERMDELTSGLDPGVYKIVLKGNQAGDEVVSYLEVFDPAGRTAITGELAWSRQDAGSYQPGQEALIRVGTPFPEGKVYYTIDRRGKDPVSGWQNAAISDPLRIRISEEDRGGLYVQFVFVQLNRVKTWTERIDVPWTNKELDLEFTSFRDNLLPGEDESWEIRISGPGKDRVAAEVLASLYDASLDAFVPFGWNFSMFPTYRSYLWLRSVDFSARGAQGFQEDWGRSSVGYPRRRYPEFNWPSGYGYGGPVVMRSLAEREAPAGYGVMDKSDEMADQAVPSAPVPGMVEEADGSGAQPGEEPTQPSADMDFPVRENLDETVFFYPDLRTDEEGNVIVSFRMNEALTSWKAQVFAFTKELESALITKEIRTSKNLMVIPNLPRFLREGDEMVMQAKVNNLTDSVLTGSSKIEILDPMTEEEVTSHYLQGSATVGFTAGAKASTVVSWRVAVPELREEALIIRVKARAGDHTDGEQNILPVLTNRVLVTETMPMPLRSEEERTFTFSSFVDNQSKSLTNYNFTLEFTQNPVWYAVQALPYIMEYPHECTEQVFHRFYAHSLGTNLIERYPKIKAVFESWRGTDALESNLLKNEELKSALLEETPWVLDALDESEQKKRIALLFDFNQMRYELQAGMDDLRGRQFSSGAFPWFPGGRPSWQTTMMIVEGMGHLRKLDAFHADIRFPDEMMQRAVAYTDSEAVRYFERNHREKEDIKTVPASIVYWMYGRTFYPEYAMSPDVRKIYDYYLSQIEKTWYGHGIYLEGQMALILHRNGRQAAAEDIIASLKERAIRHPELGMYWKHESGYHWYQLPVETQALMIELFSEMEAGGDDVDELRVNLLKHKQTNRWNTTKSTASAIYALLVNGSEWLGEDRPMTFEIGEQTYTSTDWETEKGTGYFKESWGKREVGKELGTIRVSNPNPHIAWGAAYWQYYEDIDKVTSFRDTPLEISKEILRERWTESGPELEEYRAEDPLQVGDRVVIRIMLRVDRPMEFVHLKDYRAAGMEPMDVLSGYRYQGGLGYYQSTRDLATHFFMDYLPKGTHVLEYGLYVNQAGSFSAGMATLQCMYAPEFTSHSQGQRVEIQ